MSWKKIRKISAFIFGFIILIMMITSVLILVYKEDIKRYALEEANQYLNKRVHVGHIDVGIWKSFPSLTLSFDNVLIYDRFDTIQKKDTALYAQNIALRLNLLDFYNKNYRIQQIDIKNGQLNLKILEDGKINYDFLKESENTSQTPFSFDLNKIRLKNVDFTYSNEVTKQYHSAYFNALTLKGAFTEKQFILSAKSDFLIKKIQSKSLKLIENQKAECAIKIRMDQINSVFEIESADLKINTLPFHIKGKISDDSLNFYIGSKDLSLVEVAQNFSLQELEKLREIQGTGKVNFELFIQGKTASETPLSISADFSIKEGSLKADKIALSKINLRGQYSNGIETESEFLNIEELQLYTLNQDFKGKLRITNFENPRFVGNAKGILDLNALHLLFGPFSLDELQGNVVLDGNFDVQVNVVEGRDNLKINHLNSSLDFSNVVANSPKSKYAIEIPNGHITVRNQYAGITNLTLEYGSSSVTMDGEVNHIIDFLDKKAKLFIDADVTSENISIDEFISAEKETSKDWLLPDNVLGSVRLDVNNLSYSGHQYSAIKTKLLISERQLQFPYLSGSNSGARVEGSLMITEESPMVLLVETALYSNNVKFQPLFKEWNNFGQEVIKSENIVGNAAISLNMKAPFDIYNATILKDRFEVQSVIEIGKGELINVQTFKKITESLKGSAARLLISKAQIKNFEERLLYLKFDAFQNELSIENGMISIPKMTIKSNALDVTLEGTHSFDNEIDYSFEFRFRDIKGNSSSEFGEIIDDETGFRIYLKMKGTMDNPSFSWDKEAKKKAKEEKKQEVREDFKSTIKSGFGINKRDSTILRLEQEKHLEDKIYLDFNRDSIYDEFSPNEKEKKKSKLQEKIDRWKKENKKEENEFIFE